MSRKIKQEFEPQKEDKITEYQKMWLDLGITDNAPRKPQWKPNQWQKVFTDKGWVRADQAMRDAGFIADNIIPTGVSGFGSFVNMRQINSLALDNVFLSWGELSLLQQNCLINNICTIMADSMTAKWITFNSTNESKKDKIKQLEEAIVKFKLQKLFNLAVQRMMLLGTVYLSPKFVDDEDDLTTELLFSPAKIKQGSLEAFYVIEPTWVVPIDFNMTNPRAPNFYKPTSYVIYGERIHSSRMRQMVYIEPVNLLASMYLFGGQPFIQTILPYILDFINSKKEVVKIISRYNINILQTDLNALHGTDAYAKGTTAAGSVKGRLAAFNALRTNFGTYLLYQNEQFTQIQIPLTGLTDVLQQQGEFLSLFSRIPVSKLFGQAPRGMNATGEYDANNFNQLILSDQESKIRPELQYAINCIQMHLWGELDREIEFSFVPVDELNEKSQSDLKTDKVNRAVTLVQAGMADPTNMMEVLQKDPDLELDDYQQPEQMEEEPDEEEPDDTE